VLIDYGHEAGELYSPRHAGGTLRSFRRHMMDDGAAGPAWLQDPGERDITSHVDFTSVRRTAEDEGCETLGLLDQTYFLLGLGLADRLSHAGPDARQGLKRRLAAKTLMLPGGLGSTHKVLILGKGVGRPALRGTSYRHRIT
jgi:SAM-dependent MidA family methyltransferase